MGKDLKPVFDWAKENGDANIYDRVLIKLMPKLIKEKIMLTSEFIEEADSIVVSEEIYLLVLEQVEELLGVKYV